MNEEPQIPESLIKKITVERIRRMGAKRIFWPRGIRLEMLRLHGSGISTTRLEAATGISSSVIYKWATKRSLTKKVIVPRTADPSVAKFSELRIKTSDVVHQPELRVRIGNAEIFGFTANTLAEFFRDAGWSLR